MTDKQLHAKTILGKYTPEPPGLKIIPSVAVKSGHRITCTNYFTKEISGFIVNDYDYVNIKSLPVKEIVEWVQGLKEQKTV